MSDVNQNNQRKKSRSRWLIPAIIALLIGFVVVQLLLLDETREQHVADEVEDITAGVEGEKEADPTNAALRSIDEYIVFVSENNPDDNSLFVSEYIASALDHLTDALEELSAQKEIQLNEGTITQLKEQSDRIADAEDQEKAVLVKNSFIMISETMESLNLEGSERLETEIRTLQDMVSNIDSNNVIEEQDEAVSQFLEQTGIVLELIENEV